MKQVYFMDTAITRKLMLWLIGIVGKEKRKKPTKAKAIKWKMKFLKSIKIG